MLHGVDGWVLEDMDWCPQTGLAVFEYFNVIMKTHAHQVRLQPTHEGHLNWEEMRDVVPRIFGIHK